jgi:hypothetical protein
VTLTGLPNLKDKLFGGAYSVWDERLCAYRDEAIKNFQFPTDITRFKYDYFDLYRHWMLSSHPKIVGLEQFHNPCYINGTSDAFGQFYIKYHQCRRLRLKRGEYFYHQWIQKTHYKNRFTWLEDEPIIEGDVVMISVPFANTGNCPESLEQLLTRCDELNCPVMLDFAYLNLSIDFTVDLNHPCIEYIVTSLSKVFPIENWRIGIRWQRSHDEDPITIINEDGYEYLNIQSMSLGVAMMTEYEADWTYKQYRSKQLQKCKELALVPSDSVYFGLDYDDKYPEYSRGGDVNRLCFTRLWDGRLSSVSKNNLRN